MCDTQIARITGCVSSLRIQVGDFPCSYSVAIRVDMEMLAHSHYESMFSSTALVYRRSHMYRFECNVRMCAEELLP